MKDYEKFENAMKINGLHDFLVNSLLEAVGSQHENSIVYKPDQKTGKLIVYLVGNKDGVYTEYAWWSKDEFEDDSELINTVIEYVLTGFKGPKSFEENLKELNSRLKFYKYPSKLIERAFRKR